MARVKGGGFEGPGASLVIPAIPDATFETEIDALIAASTDVIGKLVTLTFLNNYEVTSAAESAIPDGVVVDYYKSGTSYCLSVELLNYIDQNTVNHMPRKIMNFPYAGTFALQDSVVVNTTTYLGVKDGGTGGRGACIAKDTPTTGYADILF